MGLLSAAIKGGIAMKVFQVVKREAGKPQNQRKAKALFRKLRGKVGR